MISNKQGRYGTGRVISGGIQNMGVIYSINVDVGMYLL